MVSVDRLTHVINKDHSYPAGSTRSLTNGLIPLSRRAAPRKKLRPSIHPQIIKLEILDFSDYNT